ncbi:MULTISPECIES: nitrite reductase [Shewanella]|uniref:nitrite reductase n=1 Tax=Shewanella TaxID=22 RepID=UPI00048B7D8C|nr:MULTISPECIES: nitrite reductase [Shewanella]QLE86761.1 nitrite reductase [Shewanella sp. Scap07]
MSKISKIALPLLTSILVVFSFSSPMVKAETSELKMNQNRQCIMCHKKNGNMYGLHANDALGQTCQDCHGDKGKHPRGESDLIGFSQSSPATVEQQTAACMSCHDQQELSEADWTHNVHSNKVNCAGCHQLHPEVDPIIGISESKRIASCVSCHESK